MTNKKLAVVVVSAAILAACPAVASTQKSQLPKIPRALPSKPLENLGGPDFDSVTETSFTNDTKKRKLASTKMSCGEDLMSPELKAFRNQLLSIRDPESLEAFLKKYDADDFYNTQPNDVKYVVARLSPMIPLRGIFWRMAPLAHQAVISQDLLVTAVRAVSEQIVMLENNTQWDAYMGFLAIPTADLAKAPDPAPQDGVKRADRGFYVENDLSDYLGHELYPAFNKAEARLLELSKNPTIEVSGKETPICFDNQIRFGEKASFDKGYSATERYKFVGRAEIYALMARYFRRMAMFDQMEAFNINGNIEMRKAIGKKMGIDEAISSSGIMGWGSSISAGSSGALASFEGLTRKQRMNISKEYASVFSLRSTWWMQQAYRDLHNFAHYYALAWSVIRVDQDNREMLLDPETFPSQKRAERQSNARSADAFPRSP